MSMVSQTTHRWIEYQRTLLQANIDISRLLNRELGQSGGSDALWSSFEVLRRSSISDDYESKQDWGAIGVFDPQWGAYRGNGYWYQSLARGVDDPQFPVWKMLVDDSKIVDDIDDQVHGLHAVLHHEFHDLCALISLGILQFDLDDELDRLHLRYSGVARGGLRSAVLVHRLHVKSISIAYRVNEFLSSVDRDTVVRLFGGRFMQTQYVRKDSAREPAEFGAAELSRLRKAIGSSRRRSELLNRHVGAGYGMAYGVVMFIISLVNILLVIYGIYITYLLAS